jgi:uncharacterized protein YodC (DUF2158 family)
MPANLRAKPIEGHITDSAGNVIRNGVVTVKINTAVSTQVVATTKSNDEGYFITTPLPCGTYLIYESGILISKIVHPAVSSAIQCCRASTEEYYSQDTGTFESLLLGTITNFKSFIQIEPVDFDPILYGSSYPLYNSAISTDATVTHDDLYWMAKFFNLRTDSRITTTRFDVEYYAPMTSTENNYKRIRWAGIPAIRFKSDSRLVLPLDYFSIVPSLPRLSSNDGKVFESGDEVSVSLSGDNIIVSGVSTSGGVFINFYNSVAYGDIIKVITVTPKTWYGILVSRTISGGYGQMKLYPWPSSRFTSTTLTEGEEVARMFQYDGMFQGIQYIDQVAFERFSVVENVEAQNNNTELYNYAGQ